MTKNLTIMAIFIAFAVAIATFLSGTPAQAFVANAHIALALPGFADEMMFAAVPVLFLVAKWMILAFLEI